MDTINAEISLSNPKRADLNSVQVEALVDSGAFCLCIPEHIKIQLGFQEIERREVTIANAKKEVVSYVGPVTINCLGRTSFGGALVIGDRVLLGALPMEDMDLVISPSKQTVTVNPESPNIASGLVM
ncbi:MAG: clan AA aspartic protease [Candidatus Sumerlaeota bacterium]|nr:clan AA aspartic protease [Candidatus Sumerlaeota bacterium]